jgi:hypothetical protein
MLGTELSESVQRQRAVVGEHGVAPRVPPKQRSASHVVRDVTRQEELTTSQAQLGLVSPKEVEVEGV